MAETSEKVPPVDSREATYRAAVQTAWVAATFSVLVLVLLMADFGRRLEKDPLDSEQYLALKAQLVERPNDTELIEKVRTRDEELRGTYFQQRAFAAGGTWLLLGGVIIFLIAAKTAMTVRRKLPKPKLAETPKDLDTGMTRIARWGVAGLAILLVGTTFALKAGIRTELSLAPPDDEQASADGGAESRAAVAEAYIPTAEELQRNWTRFRGPGGLGISSHSGIPTSWDAEAGEGVVWKTAVPLPGNSSPIVWENRVFLSGADEESRQVFCFDTESGKLLWQTEAPGTMVSTAEPPEVSDETGYGAPTMTTDGRRVFAMFANGDIAAVDFQGNVVWNRSLGIPVNVYGHAASITMYQDRVIIQFDQAEDDDGLSRLMALNAMTGETVWETPREVGNSWPTPIVATINERDMILTGAAPWAIAYDAKDGTEIWRAECLDMDVGPSPVVVGDVVYMANEFPQLTAIDGTGQGDVTETHILWYGEDGLPDACSPLATEEHVYVLASWGIMTCYDAVEGEFLWEWESDDSSFTSSPTLVEGNIFLFDLDGRSFILKPGPEGAEVVGEGALGEECVACPAFQDGRIFIRGAEHLFCIGE